MIINLSKINVLWTLLCCFTIVTVAEPKLFDFGSGNTFLLISAALQLRLYTVLQHLYELFWLSEKLQLSKNNLHTEKLLLLWWAGYTLRNQLIREFFFVSEKQQGNQATTFGKWLVFGFLLNDFMLLTPCSRQAAHGGKVAREPGFLDLNNLQFTH